MRANRKVRAMDRGVGGPFVHRVPRSKAASHNGASGTGVLRPPWWLLLVNLMMIAGYLSAMTVASLGLRNALNLVGPAVLGLAATVAGFQLLRRRPDAVWTPHAWFLLAVVAFYSVGPLLHSVAGSETLRLASSLYQVSADELLRTNLLDAVGVACVLLGMRIVPDLSVLIRRFQHRRRNAGVRRGVGAGERRTSAVGSPRIGAGVAAAFFLVVGGILKYLVILPARFGMVDWTVPGVVWNLGRLHLLGIAVLAYVVTRGDRRWRVPLAVLWAVQVMVAVLLFSKLELLLSIALPALGAYAAHRSVRRLIGWAVLATAVYISVPQFVLYGREQVYRRSGNIDRAGLVERAEIVRTWLARGMPSLDERAAPATIAWARLDYAPVQAFAMKRYDDGYPGETLRYAGIVLMPRLLWPDKPVTTDLGVDFYELITGRRTTHLGLGLFGEGYWNLGWPGVVVLGLFTGLVFAVVSRLAASWMRRREFLYLPSVVLGIQMGAVGTTASFANSVVGAFALLVLYAVVASLLVRLLRSFRGFRHRLRVHAPTSLPQEAS